MKPHNYRALGRLPAGQMNKTEAKYSVRLEALKQAGEIQWWKWDCINLRLADKCFYKTDFLVMAKDGTLECHEVKGFLTDDALVKLKVAADTFPFRFLLCKVVKGAWEITEV